MRYAAIILLLSGCDLAFFPKCTTDCNMTGSDKIIGTDGRPNTNASKSDE